jgi:hypothetical protein
VLAVLIECFVLADAEPLDQHCRLHKVPFPHHLQHQLHQVLPFCVLLLSLSLLLVVLSLSLSLSLLLLVGLLAVSLAA